MFSNLSTAHPPTMSTEHVHSSKDYISISLFSLLILIGLPMNISTFAYMRKRYKHAKSFLLLLHINLNITDILVLGPSTIGTLIWQLTGEWMGGNGMCKVMRFIDMFSFTASSNIMVCIALYRLYALRYPLWVSAVGHSRVPRMLVIAWGMAVLTSSPQLIVWREYSAENQTHCVNYWTAKTNAEGWGQYQPNEAFQISFYNITQAIIMFYIPSTVLIVCYVLILKDIYSTLNYDSDSSSVLYMAELTRLSSCRKNSSQKNSKQDSFVALHPKSMRGQDRFQRAKIRSLRITLLLILCYVITWLPYNTLIWLMVYDLPYYIKIEETFYFLNFLVYLNSLINPFIYGRCQGLKMLLNCQDVEKKPKYFCWILQK